MISVCQPYFEPAVINLLIEIQYLYIHKFIKVIHQIEDFTSLLLYNLTGAGGRGQEQPGGGAKWDWPTPESYLAPPPRIKTTFL